jgi:hypothetical protein
MMKGAVIRASLSDQVVGLLREGLQDGRWESELPSEGELCRDFQVSRATLRKAMEQLVRENLLAPCGRGRHHKILLRAPAVRPRQGNIIRVLSPYSHDLLGSSHLVMCDRLRERASAAGYGVEYEHQPKLFKMRAPSGLERLSTLPDTAGWVLFSSTQVIQRWFSEKGWPGVIVGPAFPDVCMPSIQPDTEASARHAAGLFHAHGHRRMVYLLPEFTTFGDRLGSTAFVEEARRLKSDAWIVGYDPQVGQLRRTLDHLLVMRPRPTAFFSNCAEHCHPLPPAKRRPPHPPGRRHHRWLG